MYRSIRHRSIRHKSIRHRSIGGGGGSGNKRPTTVLTEIPALMSDRATTVWPFLAARWRGENSVLVSWRTSGQCEMRR